ncbi:MAG: hypothetical protein K8H88_14570 [Sandaracinaceae bacterium]|nr:hypothetical protein [Sandaracinaceae bacterium]
MEQRLGVRLADLRDNMSLVDAPARWEANLCQLQGIDYEELRRSGPDSTYAVSENYADAFIGDYVRRLERVVQSYQVDHPFQDGTDTAVVSIRDDVQNVRAWCETPVANLLLEAGQLDIPTQAETGAGIWQRSGCRVTAGVEEANCVSASTLTLSEQAVTSPLASASEPIPNADLSAVTGYRVRFGHAESSTCTPPESCPCTTDGTCGLTSTTYYYQAVELQPGRYRLSWYGIPTTSGVLQPDEAVDIWNATSATAVSASSAAPADAAGSWKRYWRIFDLASPATIHIRLRPDVSGGVISQQVDLAAFMLEDVTQIVTGTYDVDDVPPVVFLNTGQANTRMTRSCEDTTGVEFRSRAWSRNCLNLCANGFGRDCSSSSATPYCYWETSFTITQQDIEAGRTFQGASFARGNYNYRLDNIAVNFVGTGVRDCSRAELPSSCYASGFIPYTLLHEGPYRVRNFRGEDYEAQLFSASIEHGRGLASERHITNPISSADRGLLDQYTHHQLRGRPLTGTYVLRVWDEPGLAFENIEDVQIVLGYDYWTRSH